VKAGLIAGALIALAVAGCGDRTATPRSPQRSVEPATAEAVTARETVTAQAEIVVTRAAPKAPARCRPRAAARAILRFFDASNRGSEKAAQMFDFDAVGGWYSVGSGENAPAEASITARDRAALQGYLVARHGQAEQLRLRELRIDAETKLGQIEFHVRRRADDLADGRWMPVEGKGAIACATGALVVWSMGTVEPDERTGRLCPRPRRRGDTAQVIACARR
jgi:hypothetical protein